MCCSRFFRRSFFSLRSSSVRHPHHLTFHRSSRRRARRQRTLRTPGTATIPNEPICRRVTRSPARSARSLQGGLPIAVLGQPFLFAEHFGKLRHIAVRNRISIARTCDIVSSISPNAHACSRLISCAARIFSRTLSGLKRPPGRRAGLAIMSPAPLKRSFSLQGGLPIAVLGQPFLFAEHFGKLRHIAVCHLRLHFGLGQVGDGLAQQDFDRAHL